MNFIWVMLFSMLMTIAVGVGSFFCICFGLLRFFDPKSDEREIREAVGVFLIGLALAGITVWGVIATEAVRVLVQ